MYQVQYFERHRFELHPENKGSPYEVLLGTLGRDFREQDPPAPPIAGGAHFKETGHNLAGAFKRYWDEHRGLFVHGYPITEPFEEKNPVDGKTYLVQYFERARFEHHPEHADSPYEVLLGLLGRQLAEKKGYPYGWYPRYGRAVDWSWVSGHVLYNEPCTTGDYPSSVRFFQYDASGTVEPRLEPVGLGQADFLKKYPEVIFGKVVPAVMFGRLEEPGYGQRICLRTGQAYVPHQMLPNPIP